MYSGSLSDFGPHWWAKGVVEQDCSPHSSREVERARKRETGTKFSSTEYSSSDFSSQASHPHISKIVSPARDQAFNI